MSERVKAGHVGMKAQRGFYEWTPETIAEEKARYEAALTAAKAILDQENARKC